MHKTVRPVSQGELAALERKLAAKAKAFWRIAGEFPLLMGAIVFGSQEYWLPCSATIKVVNATHKTVLEACRSGAHLYWVGEESSAIMVFHAAPTATPKTGLELMVAVQQKNWGREWEISELAVVQGKSILIIRSKKGENMLDIIQGVV